ncbi:MAG: hypothetical protein KC931_10615 [Candidatus Omnitrophica bacterium]|nr:hypothetical protein [Candidatus Omnitrophota bacterium]
MEELYQQRLQRYVTAMNNGKPDKIPIRPFVAEFAGKYAGFNCQEVTHDYPKGLEAIIRCCTDFDWDATVVNMVYVWTGLTQAIGLKYYGVPGIDVDPDFGFQYLEPPEDRPNMLAEEYDLLIENPTDFLFNTWLPRVAEDVRAPGEPNTFRNNLSFLKGGMAMLNYFNALGAQGERLKNECGTVSAIAGILKAPMDIIADKMRGYLGLLEDLRERPEKVLAACKALVPHLTHVALSGADPEKNVPISIWMHRGCVPFVNPKHFEEIYWPTLRPVIDAIWAEGHQTLFYAEGDWDAHLSAFTELPDRAIIYHVDRGNIFEAHKKLGHKFCLSGGIRNDVLSYGSEQEVRDLCKEVIDGVAADGGYVLDASAIVQNDGKVENLRAMTEFTREYGVYPLASAEKSDAQPEPPKQREPLDIPEPKVKPGVCCPWEEKLKEIPSISGDAEMVKRVWEENEALAYTYIWHCLLSF